MYLPYYGQGLQQGPQERRQIVKEKELSDKTETSPKRLDRTQKQRVESAPEESFRGSSALGSTRRNEEQGKDERFTLFFGKENNSNYLGT